MSNQQQGNTLMPRVMEFEQDTPEWLAWRKQHIGGSDAAALLFVDPFRKDRLKIWLDKTGRLKPKAETNGDFETPMQQGKRLEPEARDRYCLEVGEFMTPVCLECSDEGLEFMAASLDGWNGTDRIVEIKCPRNARTHLDVKEGKGKIPNNYWIQVQHQMHVAQIPVCDFVSYYKEELAIVTVEYDVSFVHNELLPIEAAFWQTVRADKFAYPDMKINLDLANNKPAVDLANIWLKYKREFEDLDDRLKSVEAKFKCMLAETGRATLPGVDFRWQTGRGPVDYSLLPGWKEFIGQFSKEQLDACKGDEFIALYMTRK